MKTQNSKWWFGVFAVGLIAPMFLSIMQLPIKEFPRVPYTEFPSQFEVFFNENLPYKDGIICVNNKLHYGLFTRTMEEKVIIGQSDWLFYNETGIMHNYRGTNFPNESSLDLFIKQASAVSEYFDYAGIEFTLLLAPNKAEIYEAMMPPYIPRRESELSGTQAIVNSINSNTNLQIVYPRDALREASETHQVYFKCDTHWNQLGAFIAVQELEQLWYGKHPCPIHSVANMPMTYRKSGANDLARMLTMQKDFSDDFDYSLEDYPPPDDWNTLHYISANAAYDETLLIVTDSFGTSTIPSLSSDFAEVYIVEGYGSLAENITRLQPDRVLMVLVERNIDSFLTILN